MEIKKPSPSKEKEKTSGEGFLFRVDGNGKKLAVAALICRALIRGAIALRVRTLAHRTRAAVAARLLRLAAVIRTSS